MSERVRSRSPWVVCGVCVATAVTFLILELERRGFPSARHTPLFNAESAAAALAFPIVGALIASRRRGNAVGWVFLGIGLSFGLSGVAGALVDTSPFRSSTWQWGVWLNTWSWVFGWFGMITFLLLLFPNGHLEDRRVGGCCRHGRTDGHRDIRPHRGRHGRFSQSVRDAPRLRDQPVPAPVHGPRAHGRDRLDRRAGQAISPLHRRRAGADEDLRLRRRRDHPLHPGAVGAQPAPRRPGRARTGECPGPPCGRRRRHPQARPVRDRRRHQQDGRLCVARRVHHGRLCGHRRRHRRGDRTGLAAEPRPVHLGHRRRGAGVPAAASARPATGQPARLREARHAVRGAQRVLGAGRRGPSRRGAAATDGQDARRGNRRGDGDRLARRQRITPRRRVVAGTRRAADRSGCASVAVAAGPASRRSAGCAFDHQACRRAAHARRGTAGAGSRVAGRPGPAQRPADRRAPPPARGASRIAAAPRGGAGRGPPQPRAEHPRWGPAAAGRPFGEDEPRPPARGA